MPSRYSKAADELGKVSRQTEVLLKTLAESSERLSVKNSSVLFGIFGAMFGTLAGICAGILDSIDSDIFSFDDPDRAGCG